MKSIIIICESTFGLDVKKIVLSINDYRKKRSLNPAYNIKGFIGTDDLDKDTRKLLSPYVGSIGNYEPTENDYFLMGIVNPCHKKMAAEKLKEKGAVFESIRAPWTLAHHDFELPEGCIFAAQSVMDSANIGKFTTLFHSIIGFDAEVGDYSSIMAFANITSSHVGKCVYIGDNSAVLGDAVGDKTVVLPNSVVVKRVKEGSTVSGIPAKKIKR